MNTNYIKYNNIEYIMPFLFCHDIYIPILNRFFENEKNPIKIAYGAVNSKWTGGRSSILNINKLNFIEAHIKKLKQYKIKPAITFSNTLITKDDLNDGFCNELLDIVYNEDGYFIIASDILYNHIKRRYSNAKLVCSVILPSILKSENSFDETKFYNDMLKKYDIVVTRPEYTIDNANKIKKLISDTDRIEVLINQACVYNCPYAKTHYELISKAEKGEISYKECDDAFNSFCEGRKQKEHPLEFNNKLMETLISAGIKKYKMQGRTYSFNELYEHIYKFCINSNYKKDEIKNKIDKISASLIQEKKLSAITLL